MTDDYGRHELAIRLLTAHMYDIHINIMNIKTAITDLENSNYFDKRLLEHYERVLSEKRNTIVKILDSISVLRNSCM